VNSAILSGHEDWVRSLAFQLPIASEDPLVLASGSQDATIRLWNIKAFTKDDSGLSEGALSDNLLDTFEASVGDLTDAEEGGRQISLKRHILTIKSEGRYVSNSIPEHT
jgi:WD40 repeat protein